MFGTFSKKSSNPLLSVHSRPETEVEEAGRGRGGAGREGGARAAATAFPIWTLTQAPGMPRKGGWAATRARLGSFGTRRCRDSTQRGTLGPGLPHTGTHHQTTGRNRCFPPWALMATAQLHDFSQFPTFPAIPPQLLQQGKGQAPGTPMGTSGHTMAALLGPPTNPLAPASQSTPTCPF